MSPQLATREDNPIAKALQNIARDRAHHGMIVGNEYSLMTVKVLVPTSVRRLKIAGDLLREQSQFLLDALGLAQDLCQQCQLIQ